MNRPVFLVPGWKNSGPGHWQSLWEAQMPDARRVEMPNWDFPRRHEWVEALDDALSLHLRFDGAPPVLVGHSVGCMAIVHWAAQHQRPVHGALLVAPADVARAEAPEELRDFAPIPRGALPFPAMVVCATDDPYLDPYRARDFAEAWRARFTRLPRGGHLNAASGFGPWPKGEALLKELMR
ncbi:MAG: alpha/beta hydrolase [Acidobacteria bacterium]|nr:alpha/beta hydrolase [Acidobacteriota bacterium]